jgi:hypothetical protein
MKIILTEDQYGQLTEMIKLNIKVGDTIMGGKFKNKKVVVKTIGKNDKGDITINGKPLLRFRIIKESTSNDIEKIYKTYSKHLNELTETFDWVSKIDVKLSSTAEAGGWRNEQSKPLVKISVYFKNYQKIKMTEQFELFDEIMFIHNMFFPDLTGDPLIYSDNVTAYFSTKSVFPNGKTDSFPSHNQIVSGDYDAVNQISESNDKNKIGSENFNRLLTKVVNSIINEYLKKTTTIGHDFDFRVKVRKGTDTPFVGCNAGSHGEPYNYVIEVYSDIEIPKYFTYNDEYKKNHNKISDGFHNSILSREIKDILPMIGLDIESLGNVFGVCFNGKTDDFSSNKPVSEAVSQISESNDKNKKFLISVMGMDFTNKIKQITSTYDVPTSFDDGIAPSTIRTYLNFWGPMYLVNIDGENYLYQDRGDYEMFIDEEGYWNKDEIPEKLGIGVLGLRFSDILDMYFEEEDQI